MPNAVAAAAPGPVTFTRRGDYTRERLLDAVEELLSTQGFQSLTHRSIAGKANAHVALLNYHFGSKEQLIEEALARRAPRLLQMQLDAFAALRSRGVWSIEDALWAFFKPFAKAIGNGAAPNDDTNGTPGPAWRHYLCLVARLVSGDPSDELFRRHFGRAERECLYALRKALPNGSEEALRRGFLHCRALFERLILAHCATCDRDAHTQEGRVQELIGFLAGGLRSVAGTHPA